MPLELIYLNSPPVVAVNSDNRKLWGKKKWHKAKFEKTQTMIASSLENKKTWQNGNQVLNQQIAKM